MARIFGSRHGAGRLGVATVSTAMPVPPLSLAQRPQRIGIA
jgi:hypothetical protein